jgi:hypothetical protein
MNAKVETLEEACLRVVLAHPVGLTAHAIADELGLEFADVYPVLKRLAFETPLEGRQISGLGPNDPPNAYYSFRPFGLVS